MSNGFISEAMARRADSAITLLDDIRALEKQCREWLETSDAIRAGQNCQLRKYHREASLGLMEEIDELRYAAELSEARDRWDFEEAEGFLLKMLEILYAAHREGNSPYCEELPDLADDAWRVVAGMTRELRAAYHAAIKAEAESLLTGQPLYE